MEKKSVRWWGELFIIFAFCFLIYGRFQLYFQRAIPSIWRGCTAAVSQKGVYAAKAYFAHVSAILFGLLGVILFVKSFAGTGCLSKKSIERLSVLFLAVSVCFFVGGLYHYVFQLQARDSLGSCPADEWSRVANVKATLALSYSGLFGLIGGIFLFKKKES